MSDKQARRVVAARPDRRGRRRLRDRVRHAQWIHQSLAHAGRRVNVPTISLHNLDRLTRQQRHAAGKGWLAAQAKLESRMLNVLAAIRVQTEDAISALQPARPASRATVQEITDDLAALEADFAGVKLHPRSHTLSVTTEPIELSGVYLGPFEIQLDLRRLDQSCAYHVIAKDPHPAATSESSTHPHVCDDRLCEGEGFAAIRRALADGRLFDFFVIVRQVLNTYNPDSAYITLADWDGIECQACGDTVEFSESACCSACDGRMCEGCNCMCHGCEESYCDDCISSCDGCESCFCSGCLNRCTRCEQPFCDHCLKEKRCDDCLEKEKEAAEAQQAAPTETEVHALRVGETEVPA